MKNSIRTILEITAVAALAALAYRLGEASRTQTALQNERDRLQQQLAQADARLRERPRPEPEPTAASARTPFRPVNVATAAGRRVGPMAGGMVFAKGATFFSAGEPPEWIREEMRAHLRSRYEPLFQRAGISRELGDKLTTLLLEKRAAATDVMEAAIAQGFEPSPESHDHLKPLLKAADAAAEERIRDLLGESAYQQYQHYEETMPHRATVDQLTQRLASVGESLTAAQAEQLVSILAATAPASSAPTSGTSESITTFTTGPALSVNGEVVAGGPIGAVSISNDTPITDAAVNQAQGILTELQQKALQQLQADRAAMQRTAETMQGSLPPRRGGRD